MTHINTYMVPALMALLGFPVMLFTGEALVWAAGAFIAAWSVLTYLSWRFYRDKLDFLGTIVRCDTCDWWFDSTHDGMDDGESHVCEKCLGKWRTLGKCNTIG